MGILGPKPRLLFKILEASGIKLDSEDDIPEFILRASNKDLSEINKKIENGEIIEESVNEALIEVENKPTLTPEQRKKVARLRELSKSELSKILLPIQGRGNLETIIKKLSEKNIDSIKLPSQITLRGRRRKLQFRLYGEISDGVNLEDKYEEFVVDNSRLEASNKIRRFIRQIILKSRNKRNAYKQVSELTDSKFKELFN